MKSLSPSQLLAEIEDVIRTAPVGDYRLGQPDALGWIGRAAALVKRWNMTKGVFFDAEASGVFYPGSTFPASRHNNMLLILHEARHDLRLNEVGPLAVAVHRGAVLDYFEEIRKVLVAVKLDVFFVDPFIDAEFISRYVPQIPTGVKVRLLSKKGITALLPAADLAATQHEHVIEVRGTTELHDRFLFTDHAAGYHSGASFKDGGRLSPTIFGQITDTPPEIMAVYEAYWLRATVHRGLRCGLTLRSS